MRFLLGQDVYAATARRLRAPGHDVLTASDGNLAQATDTELLAAGGREQRILVTRDRDFGALVFLHRLGAGVLYLRISPATLDAVHEELERVLGAYPEPTLRKAFLVVEGGRHRYRELGR